MTTRNKTQPTTRSEKPTVSDTATNSPDDQPTTRKRAAKQTSAARSGLARAEAPVKSALPVGFVSFVGSGPGDPELLTVRAVELLRTAEVVVTESPEHLPLVDAFCTGAEVVDGGSGLDGQPLTHSGRAKLVLKHAKSGRRVVRLMAGDPFVYASGP